MRVKSLYLNFFSSFKIYFPKKNLLLGVIVQQNWIVADSGGRIAAGQRRAGVPPSRPPFLCHPRSPRSWWASLRLFAAGGVVVVVGGGGGGKRETESDRQRETGGHGNS